MRDLGFLGDILNTLFERRIRRRYSKDSRSIQDLCLALLDTEGEVSGLSLAGSILRNYNMMSTDEKSDFFEFLNNELEVDLEYLKGTIQKHQSEPSIQNYSAISQASKPKRQELLQRLNQPSGATFALVQMRSDLINILKVKLDLRRTDLDFVHLLRSWFNRGFLVLRQISWETPASILEKIVEYEAVHAISDWSELRRRLYPKDRKCFAFFHPSMPTEPLIFVEVALTHQVPKSIQDLLDNNREPVSDIDPTVAVFYSISNCQAGLAGISFGNFLIKQVAAELQSQYGGIEKFVTLSPVPSFKKWFETNMDVPHVTDVKNGLAKNQDIRKLVGHYLTAVKGKDGFPIDPVARFHLGNGAQILEIHPQADLSDKGISQSMGVMVNYEYDLNKVEQNHEHFVQNGRVCTNPRFKLETL